MNTSLPPHTNEFRRVLKQLAPIVFFGILALVITTPLLGPGYILSLDTAFTPNWPLSSRIFGYSDPIYGGNLTLDVVIGFFSILFPVEVLHKGYIFLIFFSSGILMYHLMSGHSEPARYFAGVLYMVNPFVYIKGVVGSWMLLAGYAAMPLAIKRMLSLFERPRMREAILLALAMTVVAINVHIVFLTIMVGIVFVVVHYVRHRAKTVILWMLGAAGIWFALNLYWILPLGTAETTTFDLLTQQDQTVFTSRTADFNALFTIASLHGYWRSAYLYTKDLLPWWPLIFAVLLYLSVQGTFGHWRDWKVQGLAILGILALILGTGISGPFSGLSESLSDNVPIFRSMRDSHKYVALLVLVYAYLGALGIGDLWKSLHGGWREWPIVRGVIFCIVVGLPLLYTLGIFGWQGQLKPTPFPEDWYAVNQALSQDPDDVSVLFLPWHQFMDFQWNRNRDKRTASLASFFNKQVVYAENLEVPGIYSQTENPGQHYLDTLLGPDGQPPKNLAQILGSIGVRYVVLAKESDYSKWYDYLYAQEDLVIVLDEATIALFRSEHPIGRAHEISSLENLSIFGKILPTMRQHPARYDILVEVPQYLSFVPPNLNARYWLYNGQPPKHNELGFRGVFEGHGKSGSMNYTRWRVFLTGYLLSGLAGLAALWWLTNGTWRNYLKLLTRDRNQSS